MSQIEVFVMIDENGDYVVSKERDVLQETYDSDIGDSEAAKRIIVLTINVPTPKPVEVSITVPEEPSESTVTVGV